MKDASVTPRNPVSQTRLDELASIVEKDIRENQSDRDALVALCLEEIRKQDPSVASLVAIAKHGIRQEARIAARRRIDEIGDELNRRLALIDDAREELGMGAR